MSILEETYTLDSTAYQIFKAIIALNTQLDFKVKETAYKERIEVRNLSKEKFFGNKPQHEFLVNLIYNIKNLTSPDVWLFFDIYYMIASNHDKTGATAFRDLFFRRNKTLKGKKFLATASFLRLVKAELLINVKKAKVGLCADHYQLGKKFYDLLETANEQSFNEVVLVNPVTRKVVKPLKNKLEDAPEQLKQLASSIDMGHQICLSTAHYEARQALKNAKTEEDRQRAASDLYVLKAITINGYQLLANGQTYPPVESNNSIYRLSWQKAEKANFSHWFKPEILDLLTTLI